MNSDVKQGLTQISVDWLRWIDQNIMRGCSPDSIIDILIENKYHKAYATQLVFARLANNASAVQALPIQNVAHSLPGYDYEDIGIKLSGHSIKTQDREIQVLMTVDKPRIILFGNVLSQEECEQMIALSKPKLSQSTTVDDQSGKAEPHHNRSSKGTYFQLNETPLIGCIDRRVSELMQMPVTHGEGLQILNYQLGGEYKTHFDYFSPDKAGSNVHLALAGQRLATLIIYLNNVEEGGETIFPEINLKIAPKQGGALYFAYTNSKNQVDPLTLHGGCPVLKGEKWIATKWMRQKEYR